ncbi:MAG: MGMT family protein, partial [Patescibacteria group bacterium]
MILSFSEKTYKATRKIPRGKISTYWEIAKAIGKPGAARAVGNALNKNPYVPKVPCHRVIKSDGSLGGFASGTRKKQKLLQSEGVIVKNGKVD